MRKNIIRNISIILALVLAVAMFTACNQKPEESSAELTTVGKLHVDIFKEAVKKSNNVDDIAQAFGENESIPYGLMCGPVIYEDGYMPGFDPNVDSAKFTQVATFAPMIGSIPYVGYVFETNDTAALLKELNEKAQLNWNICTQADEIVSYVEGNKVLFVMTPSNLDE